MLKLDFIFFPDSMFAVVFSVIFFVNKKEKEKLGEKMQNFIFYFDSFSDIACVFA
jgi:hypothetical protein